MPVESVTRATIGAGSVVATRPDCPSPETFASCDAITVRTVSVTGILTGTTPATADAMEMVAVNVPTGVSVVLGVTVSVAGAVVRSSDTLIQSLAPAPNSTSAVRPVSAAPPVLVIATGSAAGDVAPETALMVSPAGATPIDGPAAPAIDVPVKTALWNPERLTVTVCVPRRSLISHRVATTPLLLVVALAGETLPPLVETVNDTNESPTGLSFSSSTRTFSESGANSLRTTCCPSPETISIRRPGRTMYVTGMTRGATPGTVDESEIVAV